MFEVKYPNSHGLDGELHQVEVLEAYEIVYNNEKLILVYGNENKRIVSLILKYNSKIKDYILIPYTKMELINISSPYLERRDVTLDMKGLISGRKLLNLEEANTVELKQEIASNSSNKKGNNINYSSLRKNFDSDLYISNENNNTLVEQDIRELLSFNYEKAKKLLIDFFDNNSGKYQNIIMEKEIMELIGYLLEVIKEYPSSLFIEDDLIDLGCLLAKISNERVKSLSYEEIDKIIKDGYKFGNNLKERFSVKK